MSDFNKIEEKIDKLDSKIDDKFDVVEVRLDKIDGTLVKQSGDLEHHIYRTHLAEENIALIRAEIKPIKTHVIMVHGVLKFMGVLATVLGLLRLLGFM